MFSLTLLSGAGESLASNRDDPAVLAMLFGLVVVLVWAVKQAAAAMVAIAGLLRQAIAAALSALKLALIPIVVIAVLIAAMS